MVVEVETLELQNGLGILGGTFDPIHNGHIQIALDVQAALSLEAVWIMPSGNPPHKRAGEIADKLHRLEMVKLAVAGHPMLGACDIEVERRGIVYTVDTLRMLREMAPDRQLYYIVGADTLLDIVHWRNYRAALALCTLVAVMRPQWDEGRAKDMADRLISQGYEVKLTPISGPAISSTEIRARLREGRGAEDLLDPDVYAYILEHSLYKG